MRLRSKKLCDDKDVLCCFQIGKKNIINGTLCYLSCSVSKSQRGYSACAVGLSSWSGTASIAFPWADRAHTPVSVCKGRAIKRYEASGSEIDCERSNTLDAALIHRRDEPLSAWRLSLLKARRGAVGTQATNRVLLLGGDRSHSSPC